METNLVSLPGIGGATDYASKVLEWIFTAPIELFGVVVLIGLGYALKMIPRFPNEWIPVCVVATGTVLYAFGFPPSRAPQVPIEPRLFMGLVGFVAGMASWAIHRTVLRRWIDQKVFRADGDTMILSKEEVQAKMNEAKDKLNPPR